MRSASSLASVDATALLHCAMLLSSLFAGAWLSGSPAMIAPFCASCALLVLMPSSPFSAPRTVIVAHAACICVGAACGSLPVPALLAALLAAWLAIAAMAALRAIHAPAVAHTVILALGNVPTGRYGLYAGATAAGFALFSWVVNRRIKERERSHG